MGFYNSGYTPGLLDYLAWQGNISSVARGLQKPVNERLALKMATLADKNYPGNLGEIAAATGNWLAHLSWGLLHDKDRDEYEHWLPEMLYVLCLMSCEGPCKKVYQINEETGEFLLDGEGNMMPANSDWPDFVCNNSLDNPHPEGEGVYGGYNPWCNQDLWESVGELAKRCKDKRLSASKGPGVDYMLAYNVYHLLNESRPFFNPFVETSNNNFEDIYPYGFEIGFNSHLLVGDRTICETPSEYRLSNEVVYDDVTWEISDNLSFVNSSSNDDVIFLSPESVTGPGFVRAITETGECVENVYEEKLVWGPVRPTIETTIEICPGQGTFYITNDSDFPSGTTFEWIAISGVEFLNNTGSSVSFIGTDVSESYYARFQIRPSDECGVGGPGLIPTFNELIEVENCDKLKVFPNPTSGIVTIELTNNINLNSESGPYLIEVVSVTSREIVYSDKVNSSLEKKTMSTSTWNEGVYQVTLRNGTDNIFIENLIVKRQ